MGEGEGLPRVGFLGAGRMASALAAGWARAGLISPASLGSAPSEASRRRFAAETALTATADNAAVVAGSDVLVLGVKPQVLPHLLAEVAPLIEGQLVVSIAAGVTLEKLAAQLPGRRLIRVMPNTPSMVGAGAAGYAVGANATDADADLVGRLFDAAGKSYRLPEHLLNALTGVSGSGPAYGYVMIEALSDGGVRMGLPRAVATELAAWALLGAARMVLETGEHPGRLKDNVTSPAGTTIEGLLRLERGGVRAALIEAVEASARRAAELG